MQNVTIKKLIIESINITKHVLYLIYSLLIREKERERENAREQEMRGPIKQIDLEGCCDSASATTTD